MATRQEIREAFYAELESVAAPTVSSDNIGLEEPNSEEDLPAIVHNDVYRPVPINRGTAPIRVTTDSDGVQERIYPSHMQVQFTLTILDQDESVVESVYESIRSHFDEYTKPIRDASEIQSDVHRVEVQESLPNNLTDRTPPAHGDALVINLGYQRKTVESVDPATEVTHQVDGNDDDTIDETYTTIG